MTSIDLQHCLDASEDVLSACLAAALKTLPPGSLPLQACCAQGGLPDPETLAVSILGLTREPDRLVARAGIFFDEVVGGCSCHDDPVRANAYCRIEVIVSRADGETVLRPLQG